MFKVLKPLALAAVVTVALTSAADAGHSGGIRNASFEVPTSVFSNPTTLVFVPKNGKYELKEIEGAAIQVRLKAEKARRAWISNYHIKFDSPQGTTIVDSGWQDLKVEKLDKKFTLKLTEGLLKSYVAEGQKYCNQKGNPLKKVVEKDSFGLYAHVRSKGKNVAILAGSPDRIDFSRGLPIYFACMPEPFEVKDVQLSVKYEGNSRDCPVKATLQARFKTNKPEKQQFTFVLVRDNGMKQEVTRYAYPQGNGGVATWQKKYTFTKTERRKYMIYVKGHKATAMWVPVGANCSSGPAGGFSNGPIPTN